MALLCPLCMGVNFTSEETLLYDLIAFSSRQIVCPLCSDVLKGFDKFTVHLCAHILNCGSAPVTLNLAQTNLVTSLNEKLKGIDLHTSKCHDQQIIDLHSINTSSYNSANSINGDSAVNKSVDELALNDETNYLMQFSKNVEIRSEKLAETESTFGNITDCSETLFDAVWPSHENNGAGAGHLEISQLPAPVALLNDSAISTINRDDENNANILHVDLASENVPVTVIKSDTNGDSGGNVNKADIYQCTSCSTSFSKSSTLMLHNELMHGENNKNVLAFKYQCHQCQKKFKIRGSLLIHQQVAHHLQNDERSHGTASAEESQNQDTQYYCNICFKYFKKEYYLNQHLKTHDGKKWNCEECGKMFTTKYFLKKHKRLHTGEMPYSCHICDKNFTFQQSYHRHMLYHSDEKPYSCEDCGKSFKELSTLYNHQRIHTGEKPYSCNICGKSFRQRVACLVHSRTHSGSKPFRCSQCQRTFKYKVSLRGHKCNIPAEEPDLGLGNVVC
ncbi:zinc finger protein 33B [Planococcus citri]|uniref:zinc finger protein 33B n=1 Tax=Planococcus citri TaxID=170843 RepID=UPI0031F90F82